MKALAAVFAFAAAACFGPSLATYLAVPVVPIAEQDLVATYVPVPLPELAARGIDPLHMAVYHRGRRPIPHLLDDTDGDGAPDTAWVCIDVPAAGTRLTFLSPGPPAAGRLWPPNPTVRVDLLWHEAYR